MDFKYPTFIYKITQPLGSYNAHEKDRSKRYWKEKRAVRKDLKKNLLVLVCMYSLILCMYTFNLSLCVLCAHTSVFYVYINIYVIDERERERVAGRQTHKGCCGSMHFGLNSLQAIVKVS